MRRLVRATVAAAGLLIASGGCGGPAWKDYSIQAVELRQAPKLEFLRARVGMKFLEVRFDFENGGNDPVTLRAIDFALRDTAGTLYPFSAQVLDMGQPAGQAQVDMQPGLKLSGSVVFQIPERSVPGELIYKYEVNGGLVVPLKASG
jgi:hypothetical protein